MPVVSIPKNEPREYVHHTCGYTTIMPDDVIRTYLVDPHAFGNTTFCAKCQREVPDSECTWVETGEQLRSYMTRLQRTHVPIANMEERHSFHLRPNGFRRILAIALFVLCAIIPVQTSWKDGKLDERQPNRSMIGTRILRGDAETSSSNSKLAWYVWPLSIVGSIFSLMLYCPGWGFKRYALLCGPIVAIGSILFLSYWLSGRTQIYRFEPVLIAFAGAAPGVALWVMLILTKARRKGLILET